MVYDTKTKEWCSVEKTIVFDSIIYRLKYLSGDRYDLLTEDEFSQRCELRGKVVDTYLKNLKRKNKMKQDMQIAVYEIIEMLTNKSRNFDKIRAHVAMLEEMQRRLDAIGKDKEK